MNTRFHSKTHRSCSQNRKASPRPTFQMRLPRATPLLPMQQNTTLTLQPTLPTQLAQIHLGLNPFLMPLQTRRTQRDLAELSRERALSITRCLLLACCTKKVRVSSPFICHSFLAFSNNTVPTSPSTLSVSGKMTNLSKYLANFSDVSCLAQHALLNIVIAQS